MNYLKFFLIFISSLIAIPNSLAENNVNYEAEITLRANLTTVCDAYKKNLLTYETNKYLKDLGLKMHATYYQGLEDEKNRSVAKIYSEAKESYVQCWDLKNNDLMIELQKKDECRRNFAKSFKKGGDNAFDNFGDNCGSMKDDLRDIQGANAGMDYFFFMKFYREYEPWGATRNIPYYDYALISNLVTTCNAYNTKQIGDFQKQNLIAIGIDIYDRLGPLTKEKNFENAMKLIKKFEARYPQCLTGI